MLRALIILPFIRSALQVDGIGEPLVGFQYKLYAAVLVNAALFVFTFRAFERALPNVRELYVFAALLVFMIFVMRQLERVYPTVPKKTQVQVERERIIYSRVVNGEISPDSNALNLDESMLGFALDKVRNVLADRAKSNKAIMTRTAVPADFDVKQLGKAQTVNFAVGGSARRVALESQVAKAVNDLAENTTKALEMVAARKAAARGDQAAIESALEMEASARMAAEEHASFFTLAAETALAEGRGLASSRRTVLELAVARAVTELAEATAEEVDKSNPWDGSAEVAAVSAAEQASFFSLAADIAKTEALKASQHFDTRTWKSIPYSAMFSTAIAASKPSGVRPTDWDTMSTTERRDWLSQQ
jgi:hypothetical protein